MSNQYLNTPHVTYHDNGRIAVYDYKEAAGHARIEFWKNEPTDNPSSINGFNGTFAFTSTARIPEPLLAYLFELFKATSSSRNGQATQLANLGVDAINKALNDVWEGPGSMVKIAEETERMRAERARLSELESN